MLKLKRCGRNKKEAQQERYHKKQKIKLLKKENFETKKKKIVHNNLLFFFRLFAKNKQRPVLSLWFKKKSDLCNDVMRFLGREKRRDFSLFFLDSLLLIYFLFRKKFTPQKSREVTCQFLFEKFFFFFSTTTNPKVFFSKRRSFLDKKKPDGGSSRRKEGRGSRKGRRKRRKRNRKKENCGKGSNLGSFFWLSRCINSSCTVWYPCHSRFGLIFFFFLFFFFFPSLSFLFFFSFLLVNFVLSLSPLALLLSFSGVLQLTQEMESAAGWVPTITWALGKNQTLHIATMEARRTFRWFGSFAILRSLLSGVIPFNPSSSVDVVLYRLSLLGALSWFWIDHVRFFSMIGFSFSFFFFSFFLFFFFFCSFVLFVLFFSCFLKTKNRWIDRSKQVPIRKVSFGLHMLGRFFQFLFYLRIYLQFLHSTQNTPTQMKAVRKSCLLFSFSFLSLSLSLL